MNPAPSSSGSPMNSHAGVIGSDLLLGIGGKVCSRCGLSKPEADFNCRRRSKDGLAPWCRECERAYRAANKDYISAREKAQRLKTKEEHSARDKAYYSANRESIKSRTKKHYSENKEQAAKNGLERQRRYRESLAPTYVRNLLRKGTSLSASDFPPDIEALKRAHLKLSRTLKEQQQ
jgi:hypothetical protein